MADVDSTYAVVDKSRKIKNRSPPEKGAYPDMALYSVVEQKCNIGLDVEDET